jgi:hypothetical protein
MGKPKTKIGWQYKTYQGEKVQPVKYVGRLAGKGNYMAAQFADTQELVLDKEGKPLPYSALE